MAEPWNFEGESASLGSPGETVTLFEGHTFCISQRSGDVVPGSPQGVFFRDVRILSRLEVTVDGAHGEPLGLNMERRFSADFVVRFPSSKPEGRNVVVFRRRYVGRGLLEEIRLRNYRQDPCSVVVSFGADFAHVFDVKEGRFRGAEESEPDVCDNVSVFGAEREEVGVTVTLTGDSVDHISPGATFQVTVPAFSDGSLCIEVVPRIGKDEIEPRFTRHRDASEAMPERLWERWAGETPIVDTDHEPLREVVQNGIDELGFLRMVDPDNEDRMVVAAGVPWFMTLFGRDSLITGWMALLADSDLALGVLQTLARYQGTDVNEQTEEEPGRILHEVRFGGESFQAPDRDDALPSGRARPRIYYGTADATPLFVMLLGELKRWGHSAAEVDELLPHADAALEWMLKWGDRDGDGYVEYKRTSSKGLVNQGWKDSPQAIRFADGRVAQAPIALAEVQGYVYAAFRARAHFAYESENHEEAARWLLRSDELKARFNQDFWLEDKGWFAMALDRDKVPVDGLGSNMGHCLWTGIIDDEKAALVAERLLAPELFSGWGIRTLATTMVGYDPISYHQGSVWPHDNAIIAAGLMRYGFEEEAKRVIMALVGAGMSRGGHLPELFTGLDNSEFPSAVTYPTSCSPQAWAAASPLLFLRTLLRFEPEVTRNRLWVSPCLPDGVSPITVSRIPLNGGHVTVRVDSDGSLEVTGVPMALEVCKKSRPFHSGPTPSSLTSIVRPTLG